MPGSPGQPLLTEEWQIALATVTIISVAWILFRIARRIAERLRSDRDQGGDPD